MNTVPNISLNGFSTIIKNRIVINRITMFTSFVPKLCPEDRYQTFVYYQKARILLLFKTKKGNTIRLSFAFLFIVNNVEYNG